MLFEKITISNLIFGIILLIIGTDILLKNAFGFELSLMRLLFETEAAKILVGFFLIFLGVKNMSRAFTQSNKKSKQHFQYKRDKKE